MTSSPQILLSSDSLSGYGLDHIFEIASEVGFDGIDLATWKNYDARNESYVSKLSKKHDLPVRIIQVSSKVNTKEMEQAFDLCDTLDIDTIAINAPGTFNFKTFNFIVTNLKYYRKQGVKKHFAIINPKQKSFAGLIPKYHFANIIDIIKKYKTKLALDIANIDEEMLETHFLRKAKQFAKHTSVIYLSDKTRDGKGHIPPGEGALKIHDIINTMQKNNYQGFYSIKIDISQKELSDSDKAMLILKKSLTHIREGLSNSDD